MDTKLNHFSEDNIFSKKNLNVVANPEFHVTRCFPGVTWQNVWVGEQSNKELHLNRKIIFIRTPLKKFLVSLICFWAQGYTHVQIITGALLRPKSVNYK